MLNIAKQKLLVLMQNLQSQQQLTARKNPRQCNNIQANANDSNEENSDSSQFYSVATINKIDVKHKYMEVRLNAMPLKCLLIQVAT